MKFLVLRTVLRNVFSITGSFRNVITGNNTYNKIKFLLLENSDTTNF